MLTNLSFELAVFVLNFAELFCLGGVLFLHLRQYLLQLYDFVRRCLQLLPEHTSTVHVGAHLLDLTLLIIDSVLHRDDLQFEVGNLLILLIELDLKFALSVLKFELLLLELLSQVDDFLGEVLVLAVETDLHFFHLSLH